MKALVIYRANDLYNENFQVFLQRILVNLGYTTDVQSFPAGTDGQVIAKWLQDHWPEVASVNAVLYDNTVAKQLYSVRDKQEISIIGKLGCFDDAAFRAAQKAILMEKLSEEQKQKSFRNSNVDLVYTEAEDPELYSGMAEHLLSLVISNGHVPTKVFIITHRLSDHQRKDYTKNIAHGQTDVEVDLAVAQEWKAMFVKSGLPAEAVVILEGEPRWDISDQLQAEINQAGNWLMYDRHLRDTLSLKCDRATWLCFPLENLLRTFVSLGWAGNETTAQNVEQCFAVEIEYELGRS